jgi:hypothetical protein
LRAFALSINRGNDLTSGDGLENMPVSASEVPRHFGSDSFWVAGTQVFGLVLLLTTTTATTLHVVVSVQKSITTDVQREQMHVAFLLNGILLMLGCLLYLLLVILCKWLVIGRLLPGSHDLYSGFFVRWWWIQKLCAAFPTLFVLNMIRDMPLTTWFYYLMGVRIGPGPNCHLALNSRWLLLVCA